MAKKIAQSIKKKLIKNNIMLWFCSVYNHFKTRKTTIFYVAYTHCTVFLFYNVNFYNNMVLKNGFKKVF